ncbi:hypothetical protein JMUB6875_66420 [Nocardia sp. JMUB6875]|uniref:HEAT repeat domain-containing protein n=1 Tax=Nocardia sp. JMUB6875 TaxID=3158170 RepID=UPI0032E7E76C
MTPDEFDEVERTEDYRAIPRLRAMVFDEQLPESVRRRASDVAAAIDGTVTGEQCRSWWASGDPVVMRHALRHMERSEADVVVPVASDDTHPLQPIALAVMGFGFDAAEFVPVMVRALTHKDPAVRRAAAAGPLFWHEPVAAEAGLLAAAQDEVLEVAEAAIDTLRYYPTRRVLREIAALRDDPDERRSAAAVVTFDELRDNFEETVVGGKPKAIVRLREWMLPVHDLVAWPADIEVHEPPGLYLPRPRRARRPLGMFPESTVFALLEDPNATREELEQTLYKVDWLSYKRGTRARLAAELVAHPNPLIREIGCTALEEWGRAGDLVRLVDDPDLAVRKSAMYALGGLRADPAIAELAWHRLPAKSSTAAQEALRTYVAHAGNDAKDRLVALVRSDPREDVRYEAVRDLTGLRAAAEIHTLADLLADPPGVNWSIHTALLGSMRELDLDAAVPPDLMAVDNLHLQQALANYLARQS